MNDSMCMIGTPTRNNEMEEEEEINLDSIVINFEEKVFEEKASVLQKEEENSNIESQRRRMSSCFADDISSENFNLQNRSI